jgi:hypothetical protein
MDATEELKLLENPKNVSFKVDLKIATKFFGPPKIKGSHHVFKTPWRGEPWVNLQKDGKQAKEYQVKQLIKALKNL